MLQQRRVALADAGTPGSGVAEMRGAGDARAAVAGHALRLEHGLTCGEGTVDVADLDRAHFLQALGDLSIAHFFRNTVERHAFADHGTRGMGAGDHIRDKARNDQDGCDEREKYSDQELLGILDRAGVGFFCGLVVRIVAHWVLSIWGSSGGFSKSTADYRETPRRIGTPPGWLTSCSRPPPCRGRCQRTGEAGSTAAHEGAGALRRHWLSGCSSRRPMS